MIKTTINLNDKTLKKLKMASMNLNLPITDIIKLLMMNIHLDNKKYLKLFSRIKYQERDSENIWSCMHITLTPYEYEHFIDMRKIFKKSVSNIIAFAILRYLKIILKNHSKTKWRYNNRPIYFPIYNFQVDFFKGVESFIISSEFSKEYP